MANIGYYPATNTLLSLTIAMFLTGTLIIFSIELKKITENLDDGLEVQILLYQDLPQTTLDSLKQLLEEQFESRLEFISKEQVAQNLSQELGEDFISILGQNPLKDIFLAHLNVTHTDKELHNLKIKLEEQPAILEVIYTQAILVQLYNNLQKISLIFFLLISLFTLIMILLINNAIRLALFSQRFLIRTMKLVGATAYFIQKPFLKRAAWQGFLATFLANLITLLMFYLINLYLPEFKVLNSYTTYITLFLVVILGTIINILVTFLATRRYLHSTLEDLY